VVNSRLEYYVKWEGYEEKNNTWEPLTNLSSCVTMIADYENELERVKYIQRYGSETTELWGIRGNRANSGNFRI
jgi:hypothetical protein